MTRCNVVYAYVFGAWSLFSGMLLFMIIHLSCTSYLRFQLPLSVIIFERQGFSVHSSHHKPLADLITKKRQAPFYDWPQLRVADLIAAFKLGVCKSTLKEHTCDL